MAWTEPESPLLEPVIILWNVFTVKLLPISHKTLHLIWSTRFIYGHQLTFLWFGSVEKHIWKRCSWVEVILYTNQTVSSTKHLSFHGANVSKCFYLFQTSVSVFFLGLKRRVCSALSTTLGRWMGFLCSRRRLLVDPFLLSFFWVLRLAQSGAAFCSPMSVTRGTRRTQLEWRPCWAEVEATEESRHVFW